MGYALAGFTTFVTILGRYNFSSDQRMFAGALTVVLPKAYRKVKSDNSTKSKLKLS
jgi:hypothetical protein